uniref:J domain-containing protein n=1 Tax=Arion vulgaris TaxID=1028688 RepID=A0A0B7AXE6_9EUPU
MSSTRAALKTVPAVPSLFHLAATRTLTVLRPKQTHYEILDLSPLATAKDIRQAFLKLSKQCHPDTSNNHTNQKKFVQVNEAYTVLSKPASRREYDASLHIAASTSRSHPYGHHQQSDYYSYKGQSFDETDRVREHKGQHSSDFFTTFCLITAGITFATVYIIMHYMETIIPIPNIKGMRKDLTIDELKQHDLFMVSEYNGVRVHYYAVPTKSDPETYAVLAVQQTERKDSD